MNATSSRYRAATTRPGTRHRPTDTSPGTDRPPRRRRSTGVDGDALSLWQAAAIAIVVIVAIVVQFVVASGGVLSTADGSGWPRPSAYTREFRKLTCVGPGPRPRRVCRHWGFCGRGIGVFWVQALVFLRPRHWCFCAGIGVFVVVALVFLRSWHWCFCGRGIGARRPP